MGDEPYFTCNVDKIIQKLNLWKHELPNIDMYYAMKCNNDPVIIEKIVEYGFGFDCSSKEEIQTAIPLTKKIIFAHPVKMISHLQYCLQNDISLITFDSLEELDKLYGNKKFWKLLLRIEVKNTNATHPLNDKFGCPHSEVKSLILTALARGFNVVGLSFHVGSGCSDHSIFEHMIRYCGELFHFFSTLSILDIGGGFNSDGEEFKRLASNIRFFIQQHIPANIKIIAEPGRFIAQEAYDLHLKIIGKKIKHSEIHYYLNDGLYGTLNSVLNSPKEKVIFEYPFPEDINGKTFDSTFWGPTCDSIDIIKKNVFVPELKVGDKIIVRNYGAYTRAIVSNFNGYGSFNVFYNLKIYR
jgi:ornithine decarboxylase